MRYKDDLEVILEHCVLHPKPLMAEISIYNKMPDGFSYNSNGIPWLFKIKEATCVLRFIIQIMWIQYYQIYHQF